MPVGQNLASSKTLIAAAAIGVVFAAGTAHAQNAQAPGSQSRSVIQLAAAGPAPAAQRMVAPGGVTPYAQAGDLRSSSSPQPAANSTSSGNQVASGGEHLFAPDVFATVAAARAAGVAPAALLALQAQSLAAMDSMASVHLVNDSRAPIDGPYAYMPKRFLADVSSFGPTFGITGGMNSDAERKALLSLRNDPYAAGLMAGAKC